MAAYRIIQDIDEIDSRYGGADTEHHTKCARARYPIAILLHAQDRYLSYWILLQSVSLSVHRQSA